MKPFIAFPVAGILIFGLSACTAKTYPVTVNSAPALSAYANYEGKMPGYYALYVEAEKLKQVLKFTSYGCGAHNYPADAREAFKSSALQSLEHLIEHVEAVPQPIIRSELRARGYDGIILLEVEDMDVVMLTIPGLWNASALAGAKISVSMSVEGKEKRLLGGFVEGSDENQEEMERYCAKGEVAAGKAIEGAISKVLKRLTGMLSNMTDILKQESPPMDDINRSYGT